MCAYSAEPGATSSAPTTSTAPAAMAASGCSAAGPITTIGVARLAMMRSIASSPPDQRSRSSRTAAGRALTTSSSAATGSWAPPTTTSPGWFSSFSRTLIRVFVPATIATRTGAPRGVLTGPGSWVSCDAGTGPPATEPGRKDPVMYRRFRLEAPAP